MTRLLALAAAGAMSLGLPAYADGPGYVGACHVGMENDTTPGGTFGGQDAWTAQVAIAVVAKAAGATIVSASCYLRIGSGDELKVLDAVAAGPVATGAGQATFRAAVSDAMALCTHVEVSGLAPSDVCVDARTPAAP